MNKLRNTHSTIHIEGPAEEEEPSFALQRYISNSEEQSAEAVDGFLTQPLSLASQI